MSEQKLVKVMHDTEIESKKKKSKVRKKKHILTLKSHTQLNYVFSLYCILSIYSIKLNCQTRKKKTKNNNNNEIQKEHDEGEKEISQKQNGMENNERHKRKPMTVVIKASTYKNVCIMMGFFFSFQSYDA